MTAYHVTLDGQGYILDLASYRKRLVGAGAGGELAEPRAWTMDDWRKGVGYARWEPRVYYSGTNIDPTAGDLRVGRGRTTVSTPGAGITDLWSLIVYNGALYAPRGDGTDIYSSTDGVTWTNPHDTGYAGHRGLCLFNGWLMIGSSASGAVTKFDGTTWTDSWVTLTGNKVNALAPWYLTGTTGYLFAGVSQGSGGAVLYRVDSAGTITTIGSVLEQDITALIAFGGVLWVATITESGSSYVGGLYRYDGVQLVRVTGIADNAVMSFVEYRGRLWAGSRTRGKLWTISASGLDERWTVPRVLGIGGTFSYGQAIRALLVDGDRLHVPVVETAGLGMYVGEPLGPVPGVPGATAELGWSLPSVGSSGQEPRGIAAFQGQVYLTNKRSSGANVVRVDTTAHTSAALISASFDAELPGVDKLAVRVTVVHEALVAGDDVELSYDLEDAGVFTSLGHSSTGGATSKTFSFGSNVTFRRLRLGVTILLTDTSRSPAITSIVVEYRPRPTLKARWEFDCRLEGSAALPLVTADGQPEPKTGAQLADTLWTSAAKKVALAFTDLDGEAKTVELVALEERVGQQSQRLGLGTLGRVGLQEI